MNFNLFIKPLRREPLSHIILAFHLLFIIFVEAIVADNGNGVGGGSTREPVGQNLVVLLIDGYGASLFNRTNAKLQYGSQTLLTSGVQVEGLKPVFPTQSYPNWFSLATGEPKVDFFKITLQLKNC